MDIPRKCPCGTWVLPSSLCIIMLWLSCAMCPRVFRIILSPCAFSSLSFCCLLMVYAYNYSGSRHTTGLFLLWNSISESCISGRHLRGHEISMLLLIFKFSQIYTEINGLGDSLRWPRDTLYLLQMALTSPTSGFRSVGIVRLRTKTTEFILFSNVRVTNIVRDFIDI
jgi:hypothetical protein